MMTESQLHTSVFKTNSPPQVTRCTVCCSLFHCPLCPTDIYKPRCRAKVQKHFESHIKNALHHKDFCVTKCHQACRSGNNLGHFHCPFCSKTVIRRQDAIRHLEICLQDLNTDQLSVLDKMPKKNKAKAVKRECCEDEQLPPKQSRLEHTASPLCFDSPLGLFESLIQPMGAQQFFQEYWEKKPLHLQRSDSVTAAYHQSLFQLCDLQSLCSQGLEFYRDVNVVRCVNGKKKVFNKDGQLKSSVLKKFLAESKATIQFHQPQRFKDELWRIQEKLESFFGTLVGSNIYITPQQSQGLPPHYDDVEVFILQLEGEKRWLLYNPTVPLAGEYSLESEERMGSPTHDIILKAGDVLYFPRGTIHQASTPAGVDHSTHLTLSTYQRMSWGDLLLDIFPNMLYDSSRTDVSLREGMPRGHLLSSGEGQDTSKHLAACLRSLADELERGNLDMRSTHMKRDFIMNRLPPYNQQELVPSGMIPTLEDNVRLRFKDHMVVTVESSQERADEATELIVFVLHSLKNQRRSHMMSGISDEDEEQDSSAGLKFPLSHLPALRQLQRAEQQAVAELLLPTKEAKLSLVIALWSESLLDVV